MPNHSTQEIVVPISPEEMEEWLQNPTTRKVMQGLRLLREEYKEQMAGGQTLNLTSVEQTALWTCKMQGQIYGLDLMLGMRASDVDGS